MDHGLLMDYSWMVDALMHRCIPAILVLFESLSSSGALLAHETQSNNASQNYDRQLHINIYTLPRSSQVSSHFSFPMYIT